MRTLTIAVALLAVAATLSSSPLDPFAPENPVVMGRGGSFTATARGYNSFFSNPAGFARTGEFTLASVNAWAFMDRNLVSLAQDIVGSDFATARSASRSLDPAAFEALQGYIDDFAGWVESTDSATLTSIIQAVTGDAGIVYTDQDDLATILAAAGTDDIIAFIYALEAEAALQGATLPFTADDFSAAVAAALPGGKLRIGGQIGLGYVGNGLGLGLFANTEASIDGTNILQARGIAYNTITFVGGFGLSFGNLDLGVAIRPTVFGYSSVNAAPVIADYIAGNTIDPSVMFNSTVYYGSGLALDFGARYGVGPFSFGFAVRDLFGTRIQYRKTSFDDYVQALSGAALPIGSTLSSEEQEAALQIPMKVNLGFEFHPHLGVLSFLIDPRFSVDILDTTRIVRLWRQGADVEPNDVLSLLNFGGQIDVLRFMSLRAGYYGGYLSAGLGVRVFFLDVNAAVAGDFTQDASGSWGFTEVGGALEAAIRF